MALNSPYYKPSTKQPPEGQWTTGLYDCFLDSSTCLLCFCPCIMVGRIAEIVDKGTTSCTRAGLIYYAMGCCGWIFASQYRAKLRQWFSLPEEPCSDLLVHACCCMCSICQEYRELKNRGIDPSIGWQGNVEKWKQEGIKPPIAEQGMTR
ncbi:protein PLANT CADMIUM RESISTANCE 12 [Ziziphus jujuba]|uniref:Protein PLANT CADMIUM RESISTANCE 12 n=1 Tax=Ziziphus jujuba TaxID=326968 RepID=A0A6P4BA16_ZIZJJ|nr:protein PLANT CADMIUM RESISTANCE 12 [Ziziphus jujuba]